MVKVRFDINDCQLFGAACKQQLDTNGSEIIDVSGQQRMVTTKNQEVDSVRVSVCKRPPQVPIWSDVFRLLCVSVNRGAAGKILVTMSGMELANDAVFWS
ncbi:hypothetical protein D3C85_1696830 [compost metagenome]